MPVLEIEREAREAGLLGPDSPISQNKSFRSARDMLEISPRRMVSHCLMGRIRTPR
jgi:hypothetical protein